jgi:hypothetical protein
MFINAGLSDGDAGLTGGMASVTSMKRAAWEDFVGTYLIAGAHTYCGLCKALTRGKPEEMPRTYAHDTSSMPCQWASFINSDARVTCVLMPAAYRT